MFASEIYAISQGSRCIGSDECHWCAAPCNQFLHADFRPQQERDVGKLLDGTAKRPGNYYMCWGCWLWRRQRITVCFLGGRKRGIVPPKPGYAEGFMDIQAPCKHSWYIAEDGAWALSPWDSTALYEKLLKPPFRFVLSLLSNGPAMSGVLCHPGVDNLLQLAECNDVESVRGDTPLAFTLNNVRHEYTTYELGEALKNGSGEGCLPGVQALIRTLGLRVKPHIDLEIPPDEPPVITEVRKRGRPAYKEPATSPKKIVTGGSGI